MKKRGRFFRMTDIEVFTEGTASLEPYGIDGNFIIDFARKVLSRTKTDNVHMAVILTDNEEIRKINHEFRGKNQPTDVISFAYRDEPFPVHEGIIEELGDVYISLDKTAEQAEEYGIDFTDELKRLTIHGILHLLGYDHERSDEDEKEMSALEQELFLQI
jgi:probable rRNA maturation factor